MMNNEFVYRQLDTFEGYTEGNKFYYSFTKWNDEELDIEFGRSDVTLTKGEAIQLRDFLIKNYPIEYEMADTWHMLKCECQECKKSEQLNRE